MPKTGCRNKAQKGALDMELDIAHSKMLNEFRLEEQKWIFFQYKGFMVLHIVAAENSPRIIASELL